MNSNQVNKNKQYRYLLSIGNNEYDIAEPESGIISNHSLIYYFRQLPLDRKKAFLDYQFSTTPLPKVFIKHVQDLSLKERDVSDIVASWLEDVTQLSLLHRDKISKWFCNVRINTSLGDRVNAIKTFLDGKEIEAVLYFLNFGLEALEEHYSFHKLICENPLNCNINKSFEELIDKVESIINIVSKQLPTKPSKANPEFTTSRQVLAVHYMFEYMNLERNHINKTDVARFIQFLTGKEANNPKIENTSIYKKWKKILSKEDKTKCKI